VGALPVTVRVDRVEHSYRWVVSDQSGADIFGSTRYLVAHAFLEGFVAGRS
jgi:hypothetical protein